MCDFSNLLGEAVKYIVLPLVLNLRIRTLNLDTCIASVYVFHI